MASLSVEKTAEIAAARTNISETSRVTSPGAEKILHLPFHVLDHGVIRLVDYMGDDRSVPQSARVSYGKGTSALSSDNGLIRYLMRHSHSTPFEMVQAKFHVVLPVFVARQWMRHRTSVYNEYSARYSILEKEFYIPAPEHLAAQSKSNKQGREQVLEGPEADHVLHLLRRDAAECYDHYTEMINEGEDGQPIDPDRAGLARELARMNLPVNIYTQFYWSVNLWNLMHFLRLRQDSHAQYEIRAYADTINSILWNWCPVSHKAFEDYHRGAKRLSRQAAELLNAALVAAQAGERLDPSDFDLTGRELREFCADFPAIEAVISA